MSKKIRYFLTKDDDLAIHEEMTRNNIQGDSDRFIFSKLKDSLINIKATHLQLIKMGETIIGNRRVEFTKEEIEQVIPIFDDDWKPKNKDTIAHIFSVGDNSVIYNELVNGHKLAHLLDRKLNAIPTCFEQYVQTIFDGIFANLSVTSLKVAIDKEEIEVFKQKEQ